MNISEDWRLRFASVLCFLRLFRVFCFFFPLPAGLQSSSRFLGSFATSSTSSYSVASIYSFPPPWARGRRWCGFRGQNNTSGRDWSKALVPPSVWWLGRALIGWSSLSIRDIWFCEMGETPIMSACVRDNLGLCWQQKTEIINVRGINGII